MRQILAQRMRLDIFDFNSYTNKKKVVAAINDNAGEELSGTQDIRFCPQLKRTTVGCCQLGRGNRPGVSRQGLCQGWLVNCLIRRRVYFPQSFRCLEYGYNRRNCSVLYSGDSAADVARRAQGRRTLDTVETFCRLGDLQGVQKRSCSRENNFYLIRLC